MRFRKSLTGCRLGLNVKIAGSDGRARMIGHHPHLEGVTTQVLGRYPNRPFLDHRGGKGHSVQPDLQEPLVHRRGRPSVDGDRQVDRGVGEYPVGRDLRLQGRRLDHHANTGFVDSFTSHGHIFPPVGRPGIDGEVER